MKATHTRAAILCLAMATTLSAKEAASTVATPAESVPAPTPKDPVLAAKSKEQEALAIENKLAAERLTNETNEMRAQITRMKLERELAAEKLATESSKRQAALQEELSKMQAEKEKLSQVGELSKIKAEKLTNDLKVAQTESAIEIARLQNEISRIETAEKRAKFADSKPTFLKNPLRDDGVLVISDRRIELNGLISSATANYVCDRIQYWNNKDRELPIFIVIDSSPGGSVMAGYQILKSMESSDAPVHVVVKSFAASMAAAITTLAKESYAYPNAVILHHQISSVLQGQLNLTQQRELHEESERWWQRLGTPVAKKMGISPEEFVKKMYVHSSRGDWSEFGEQAKELKWVDHIVTGIDETSFTKNPDATESTPQITRQITVSEEVDSSGKPFVWLPRLNPMDVYFIYNADDYYRTR